MSRKTENTGFRCTHCGTAVDPVTNGSYRNHCPFYLYSLHVDIIPGDRQNACHGLMEPVGLRYGKNGYQIIFRCRRCGNHGVNRVADDTQQPDKFDLLLKIMQQDGKVY